MADITFECPNIAGFNRAFFFFARQLVTVCIWAFLSATSHAQDFVDNAVPKRNIYCPIVEKASAIGLTQPYSKHTLVATAQNGYIFEITSAKLYPPFGYIPKIDRQGSQTASVSGNSIEINNMISIPITPGYIPFLCSNRYPIVERSETNLLLLFSRNGILATGSVSTADCTIISATALRKEYSRLKADERAKQFAADKDTIEKVVTFSLTDAPYSKRMQLLQSAAEQFEYHPDKSRISKRLSAIDNEAYRHVLGTIEKAKLEKNPGYAAELLANELVKYPDTELSDKVAALNKHFIQEEAKLREREALRKVMEERALKEKPIRDAIAYAKSTDTYAESITRIQKAITDNASAPNLDEAKRFLQIQERGLVEYKEMRAKGYVRNGSEWLTPEEAQERELTSYLKQSYGAYYGTYRTSREAYAAAARMNQNQQGSIDSAREASMNGGGTLISTFQVRHYEVHYDKRIGMYVVY